jgi:hypothetical protein
MYRCAPLQHEVELYGWEVLWAFAGAFADALLGRHGLCGWDADIDTDIDTDTAHRPGLCHVER